MLKKLLLAVALPTLIAAPPTFAQWNYGQDMVWNSIENRIDIRKTRKRMQARKNKKTRRSSRRTSRPTKRRASVAPRKAAATQADHNAAWRASLPYVDIYRDTFQNFHMMEDEGYDVNFRFVPTGKDGKAITKKFNYNLYRSKAEFGGIPVGTYKVSAEAVYGGRKFPVHIGSQYGPSNHPIDSNLAPTVSLQVKWGKDYWGTRCLQTVPEQLFVRVIE